MFSPRCPIFRPQARSSAATRAAPRPQPTRHPHPTPPARGHAIVQREGGQARAGTRTAPGTPTQRRPPNPTPASSCLKTATITPRDRAPIRYVTFSSNFAARQDTVSTSILRNSSKSYRAILEIQGGAARANCHESSALHQRSWHFTGPCSQHEQAPAKRHRRSSATGMHPSSIGGPRHSPVAAALRTSLGGADGRAPGRPLGHFLDATQHHCRQAATRTHPPPQQRLPHCPFPLLVRAQCGMIVLGSRWREVPAAQQPPPSPLPLISFST